MVLLALGPAARGEGRKGVLLLFDEDNDLPGLALINRSVREALKGGPEVQIYSESLNLAGILTPGARIPALQQNQIVYVDGVPQATAELQSA